MRRDGLPSRVTLASADDTHAFGMRLGRLLRAGDLVVWDNRSTMHCALPFDEEHYRRMMYRLQVAGNEPH